ncbi:MAG: spore cortex-lytic enzyme [Clostridia bacterium]
MDNSYSRNLFIVAVIVLIFTVIAIFYIPAFTTQLTASYKQGSNGEVVKKIQQALKDKGYYKQNIDGIYGSSTTNSVKQFQQANKLVADGVVGAQTAKLLGVDLNKNHGNTSYSSNDVYLLAKCIYAEARGEPYEGKVAVGAVVLNRVKHPDFPNTIAGVIYQPWAFTAVHDGQINLTPDAECKRAAQDAINGWDPSNGCIYYYNPATATSKWIFSRKVMLTIGKHKFAV